VKTVAVRMAKWLRKHRLASDYQDSGLNETRVFTFHEMLAQLAIGPRTFERGKRCYDDAQASSETNPQPPPCHGAAGFCGFNSRASVRGAADARGFERLRWLSDGRYGYNVKKSGRCACRVRIMVPLQFVARGHTTDSVRWHHRRPLD